MDVSATMKPMKSLFSAILIAASATIASAQQAPSPQPQQSYEFIIAKLAAEDGRYDEALSLLDRIVDKEKDNPVLLYERAMILIDASRPDRAESELRHVTEVRPDFYDAQRVLGRLLLDRSNGDRARV